MNKYTARKLVFVGIVILLVFSPFVVPRGMVMWEEIQNPDPFKAMARYIESFEKGGVDVLTVFDIPDSDKGLAVLTYIEDYSDTWTSKDKENFTRWNLNVVRENGYERLELAIGWDYPPPNMRMQGVVVCPEPRAAACLDLQRVNIVVRPEFLEWFGIGNP